MDGEWAARLARAEEAIRRLERLRTECATLAAYRKDADTRAVAERNIQIAVEAVVDLANHWIARRAWPRPGSAPEAIDVLIRRGAVPRKLGASLILWIKSRNVIVHEYAAIDPVRIHRAVRLHLDSLRQGIRTLAKGCGLIR